ncbi:histidine kinase [Catenulispora acidiphila DSM 44928]|uniref:histidine kinase n=1 Tax=Catenulispora acidiphila (strain DSM 44928 / JCM 14897 / NBRC 102108 / NRRL B-24433 / ID139908) TaxID=479433 RepID=C7QGR8_CATAD|nr:histidine kinase [Catenulispora acidiphila]ACU74948.1 histidine kinase [Catenulispora acidiphila DSM 44928]
MMTTSPVSAPRAWARQPLVQDAALASGLLAVCLPLNNPVAVVRTVAAGPLGGAWGGAITAWGWWTATAFTLAGVALRRRWPLPMLGVCSLAVAVHLALLSVVPTVVDLSAVVLLATVAARCPRRVSAVALGGMLVLMAGWCFDGARLGRPVNGLPTFNVEVVHHLDQPGASGADEIVDQAKGSSTWSAVALLGSVLLAAWAIGSANGSRRDYLHQLHARAADLERERDQQAALAVAAERGRISREMHDVVAHGLSLIVIQAQGADAALDNRPADTRSALRAIVRTGRDSLADMRRVLAALGEVEDAWHPQPGLAQLPGLLEQVRTAGTAVRLRVAGTPAALPSAVDLSAYRIVQEALTNVMKHAGAGASADVVVEYSDTEIAVEVGDDGRIPNGHAGPGVGGGNGLRGMDRRVQLLGGRLSAEPEAGGGFRVRATLPIEGRQA